MPAFIPPIPASAAPVQSVWGVDMHRREYDPLSCLGSGSAMVGITGASRKVAIDGHSGGLDMVDSDNDQLVIPPGGAGIYICTAAIRLANMVLGSGNYMRFQFSINGTGQNEGMTLYGIGGGANWNSFTGLYSLADGAALSINVVPHASVPGDVTLNRIVIVRIGNTFGTYIDPLTEEAA